MLLRHLVFLRRALGNWLHYCELSNVTSSYGITMPIKIQTDENMILKVIIPGNAYLAPTLLVTSGKHGFLVNCPEGTQRTIADISSQGVSITCIEDILLTRKTWRHTGGLLGLGYSLQGANKNGVTIHGPGDTGMVLNTELRFLLSDNTEMDVPDTGQLKPRYKSIYEGSEQLNTTGLTVTYLPLFTKRDAQLNDVVDRNVHTFPPKTPKDLVNISENSNDIHMATEEVSHNSNASEDAATIVEVDHSSRPDPIEPSSLALLFQPSTRKPVFDLKRAFQLGVPRGPLFGKLVNGETVTLPDGRLVSPDQVVVRREKPGSFLVLECENEEELNSLQLSADEISNLTLIVHMTEENVFTTDVYQAWLSKFPETTRHIVLNSSCHQIAHERRYQMQWKLNLLDDKVFPLLALQKDMATPCADLSGRILHPSARLAYLARNAQFNTCVVSRAFYPLSLNRDECISTILGNDATNGALDEMTNMATEFRSTDRPEYPQLVMLGTNSAVPVRNRNNSGILLRGDADTSILMDSGEGIAEQIHLLFGEQTDEVLAGINAVIITHKHADHHMGLLGVVFARRLAFTKLKRTYKSLIVLAPNFAIPSFLNKFSRDRQDLRELLTFKEVTAFLKPGTCKAWITEIGFHSIVPVPVVHCKLAFGFVVKLKSGETVVYSGDTRPVGSLIEAGSGADLLIHEATMDDMQKELAVSKKHSTVSEAIDVGRKMNAKYILLTHFSARYKSPIFSTQFPPNVVAAFDFMTISLSELPLLHEMHLRIPLVLPEIAEDQEKYFEKTRNKKARKLAEQEISAANGAEVEDEKNVTKRARVGVS